MSERSKTLRVTWPVIFIATDSGTPARFADILGTIQGQVGRRQGRH
jgi:hypothetical protein